KIVEVPCLNCPFCGYFDSHVIDSRDVNDGIRRRRQCLRCDMRFTTYERLERASLFVIKKDGRREEFRREKILTGIRKACEKRPLAAGAVEKMVDDIEVELYQLGKAEIPSTTIGDIVMARLKKLDHIAYLRFASVYRDFADITMLKAEVDSLANHAVAPPADQLPLIPVEELPVAVKNKRKVRR
ncbi:MAG TPA: transcriptional regulator NrdR, partial [Dehalococcoidales bacterium]|nr:transcriptional regulator NrdR [Dehalococcoidales bacterium]